MLHTLTLHFIVFLILFYFGLKISEAFGEADEQTTKVYEEEWHMDFVPTGYLPDSVYRELAWYGVLQVQPLFRSAKHKVAARWIWQNTLGRPHAVLEEHAQTEDETSRQTLVEESAKWSREQRSAADVLMENIRSGGNGLTLRTVVSATKKTTYMIQHGKYFECEAGSSPDVDAFRAQANTHERRCTGAQPARSVPMDPCLDAELAPVEYSPREGWLFCLGDGERDATYGPDGHVDCGHKLKVPYSKFLEECAIDHNVVISLEYYGDEPCKDLVRNTTLCTTWDPCHISYLYRVEVQDIDIPEMSTTSPDPCDITECPQCLEGHIEEQVNAEIIAKCPQCFVGGTDKRDVLQWVTTNYNAFSQLYATQALRGGFNIQDKSFSIYVLRVHHDNMIIPGKLYVNRKYGFYAFNDTTELYVQNEFEVAIPKDESKLIWLPDNSEHYNAVPVGMDANRSALYLCRGENRNQIIPGVYYKEKHVCHIPNYGVNVKYNDFKILCSID